MCEQSTVQYLDGDIVWVKLGSCWWPGEVQNITKLPKDVQDSFKKPPIAAVKFFKEDKYEFVKNLDHIYKYNCRRKHEFIKKGLDKHREKKIKFMEKFPDDIVYAEVMTNGDPEIINSQEFAPDKKVDYSAIFGDSSPKKSKSGRGRPSVGASKHRSSLPANIRTPATPATPRQITHFRFIGFDDHEVQYREQKVLPSPKPSPTYKCHTCEFEASRQNVIVLHNKSHINGTYTSFSTSSKKSSPTKKHKKSKAKRIFNKDEIVKPLKKRVAHTAEVSSDESDDWNENVTDEKEKVASPVKSPKKPKSPKRKIVKTPSPPPKKSKVDIKKKLLDDWEDEDEEEEEGIANQKEDSKTEPKPNTDPIKDNKKINNDEKVDEDEGKDKTEGGENRDKPVESCFDFVEEDQEIPLQNSSPGRKIPRVIPQNQKRMSLEVESENGKELKESDKRESIEKIVSDPVEKQDEAKVEDISSAVEDLLESTKVPDIEIPQILKSEKNFHDDKTVKFPDKPDAKKSKVSESQKSPEKIKSPERMSRSPKANERLKSPEKPRSPDKLDAKGSKQSKECSKSPEKVKSPEKLEVKSPKASERLKSPENVPSPEKVEAKSPRASEQVKSPEKLQSPKSSPIVSPKIQNPKKRFVRSFADFEILHNEQSKPTEMEISKEAEPLETIFKVSDLKSQIMTKLHDSETPKRETRSSRRSSSLKEKLSVVEEKTEDVAEVLQSNIESNDVNGSDSVENCAASKTAAKSADNDIACKSVDEDTIQDASKEKLSGLSTLAVAAEEVTNAEQESLRKSEAPQTESVISETPVEVAPNVAIQEIKKYKEDDVKEDALKIDEILQKASSPVEEVVSPVKPVTLSSFSMDFSDSNNDSTSSFPCIEPTETSKKDVLLSNESVKDDISIKETELTMGKNKIEVENKLDQAVEDPKLTSVDVNNLEKENISLSVASNENLTVNTIPEVISSESPEQQENKEPETTDNLIASPETTSTSSKLLEMLKETKQAQERNEGTAMKKSPVAAPSAATNVIVRGLKKSPKTEPEKKPIYSRSVPRIVNEPKAASKFVIKSTVPSSRITDSGNNKPIIISDKIIKPGSETVSVQKVSSKRTFQDVEDIDTFIIQKPTKKLTTSADMDETTIKQTPIRSRGKAKILQQTIITPSGEVIHPDIPSSEPQAMDDNMFDINSMPIVLSDDILTPESIENMQVITDLPATKSVEKPKQAITLLNKASPKTPSEGTSKPSNIIMKNMQQSLPKNQRIYQTSSKLMKSNTAVITQPGKPGKYVIVPSSNAPPAGTKYTVGKRSPIVKTTPNVLSSPKAKQAMGEDTHGNKIMIVANKQNKQGVTSRMVLAPSQQKLVSCSPGVKLGQKGIGKTVLHSKSILTSKGTIISPMGSSTVAATTPKLSHTIVNSKGQLVTSSPNLISADGQNLSPMQLQQLNKNAKQQAGKTSKVQLVQQRILVPDQSKMNTNAVQKPRTILIKNPQGQVIKKLQAPDNSVQTTEDLKNYYLKHGLGEQISESLAAQKQQLMPSTQTKKINPQLIKHEIKPQITKNVIAPKVTPRRSYVKRTVPDPKQKQVLLSSQVVKQTEVVMPPLAPISPVKKVDSSLNEPVLKQSLLETPGSSNEGDKATAPQKPLNQLVIQDAMGNQTTVTEGQILALPSETVDGQPQSYMLVTLDESGNLTPLNNEALLSLDPNLGLGGDLSNVVLQIDQSKEIKSEEHAISTESLQSEQLLPPQTPTTATATSVQQQTVPPKKDEQTPLPIADAEQNTNNLLNAPESSTYLTDSITPNIEQSSVSYSINSDTSQQIIISGDPISAQKFLESLSEGNADIRNLLANAEGNIIINADGQQILINTDAENPMLLSVGNENINTTETNSESVHNPVMGSTSKIQDILAAALADTEVLQQESTAVVTPSLASKMHSQLSPNGSLYPSNVPNVLETSLTLGSPIMTPLEVPSISNKKVSELESDILSRVPKSLELPITITDPNISQTVSQQQALLANENLSLPLTIADPGITTTSEMNSPSYGYSLPSLEDGSMQKSSFSSSISMPLLTEEPEPETKEEASLPVIEDENQTSSFNEPLLESESSNTKTLPEVNPEENPLSSDVNPIENNLHIPMCIRNVPEMCSSLSEPPPDMFDMSFKDLDSNVDVPNSTDAEENNGLPNLSDEPLVSENSQLTDSDNLGSNLDSFGEERSSNQTPLLNLTPNSELNSPLTHFDENSCEIPIQPPIVTDLAEPSFQVNNGEDSGCASKKRTIDDCADENAEESAKKHKLD